MIMAEKENDKNLERGMDLFGECLAAMMYSDEEIRETMSPEDADEFIELRNKLLESGSPREIVLGGYKSDEESLPLAAEDEETYK